MFVAKRAPQQEPKEKEKEKDNASPDKRRGALGAKELPKSPQLEDTIKKPIEVHREDCWPDCVREGKVALNDVSQLNETEVHALYEVRTIDDIKEILKEARTTGRRVTARGTKHSMGGHTLTHRGIIIDMRYINHLHYDKEKCVVTVGSGALWADLIRYLNKFGKAPRTLQSYCSFSVGGTLSVNGHGITTDFSVSESVVSLTLITADGEVLEDCRRDSEDEKKRELFRLALGGYGLFGIIYDVTLKVNDNTRLFMDVMTIPIKEFPYIYDAVRASEDVEMKLARIDTTTFSTVSLFVFRRASDTPTVSDLGTKPKEMTKVGALMYKWFAGPMREARFALERALDVALDWSDVSDRNEMLYESAAPLARLYSPLVRVDDTFILQEYFIPHDGFSTFVTEAKDIILEQINKETLITLLNITIRYVNHDTDTALPYAQHEKGVFAFVLYYRIRKTPAADDILQGYHRALSKIAVDETQGTFYLPYRHHYTDEQLLKAYPSFSSFCSRKTVYDPNGIFGNLWWDRYSPVGLDAKGKGKGKEKEEEKEKAKEEGGSDLPLRFLQDKPIIKKGYEPPKATTRRTDSFRKLLSDPDMRLAFKEVFLVDIFSIVSNKTLYRKMVTAAWDLRNQNDEDIYSSLLALCSEAAGPIGQLTGLWKGVSQLADQKKELVREMMSIFARLGKIGEIHDYCSIGDNGKVILALRKALGMLGKAWIVHDKEAGQDDIPAVLERGALKSSDVGEFVAIDYNNIRTDGRELSKIPDESCDLVTMNQGLHHLPPEKIMSFLAAVFRVLRPGGLFIVREHDLDEEKKLMPMLDCAHMVFNAATGVSVLMEKGEIRGFRSILEWREIIEAAGFKDSFLYEMQPHDPTIDIMMCYFKPPFSATRRTEPDASLLTAMPESPLARFNFIPRLSLEVGMTVLEGLLNTLPKLRELLQNGVAMMGSGIPGAKMAAGVIVDQYINPALVMLERFRPLTAVAIPHLGAHIIPDELFLLIPALRAKAAQGGILENVIVAMIDKVADLIKSWQGSAAPEPKAGTSIPVAKLSSEISEGEVRAAIDKIIKAIPQVRNMESLVNNMGLPEKVVGFAQTYLAANGSNPDAAVNWVMQTMDKKGWMALNSAIADICKAGKPPHLSLILKEGTPWNRAAVAILGCPNVQFSRAQAYVASHVGLGDFVKLWKNAQRVRRREDAGDPGHLSAEKLEALKNPLDDVCPVKEYQGFGKLENVLAVISATYVAESAIGLLGSSTQDVTAEVAAALDAHGKIKLKKTMLPATFRMGKHSLRVVYRAMPNQQDSKSFVKKSMALNKALADNGLIDGTAKAQSGPLTWYKLPEWMQVEIVQIFGNSMDHTPWYRFPFLDIMKTYFSVLSKEVSIVAERHGWSDALGSSAFFTDLIPGIVMGLLFGQMSMLAYPLRQVVGDSYDEGTLNEQIVAAAPRGVAWTEIDSRISDLSEVVGGIWVFTIPTFKPFTKVLVKIAKAAPSATLLQISNQKVVQLRVEIQSKDAKSSKYHENLSFLKKLVGCHFNFEFEYPHVGGDEKPRTQVSLAVHVPYLLSVIRDCLSRDITIVQVYDFWG